MMVVPNTMRVERKLFMKLEISTYQNKEKQDNSVKDMFHS